MILSAMMFALGVFVTGLLALGFCIALVRRTRRITERRLMAAVTVRRAEFEAERDELRARHAVQMHRLEREVARVLDMATAHRLEADVKDRDLLSVTAELSGKQEEIQELQERLEEQRTALQELERKHAESSASLRAARHALKVETRRRAAMEDPLDQALAVADEKQIELSALRAQVEALRLEVAHVQPAHGAPLQVPAPVSPPDHAAHGAGVIPLPLRPRHTAAPAPLTTGWSAMEEVENGEAPVSAPAGLVAASDPLRAAPGAAEAQEPQGVSPVPPQAGIASDSHAAQHGEEKEEKAESLFVEALAEIRALKRAANSHAAE